MTQEKKDGGETRMRTQGAEHPENRTKGAEPQDTQEQRRHSSGAGDEGGLGRCTET